MQELCSPLVHLWGARCWDTEINQTRPSPPRRGLTFDGEADQKAIKSI